MKAEIVDDYLHHEYLPITGDEEFVKHSIRLAWGRTNPLVKENKISGC